MVDEETLRVLLDLEIEVVIHMERDNKYKLFHVIKHYSSSPISIMELHELLAKLIRNN
jgi:hypothetical protein